MIDTHAHLHLAEFAHDRWHVLTRAFALGITAIVEIAIGARGWPEVLSLAESDPRLRASLGIHPHEAGPQAPEALREMARLLPHPRVVAIGETGIDLYRDYAPRDAQEQLFTAHLDLARSTGLPLVIHCRSAFPDVLRVLDREARGPWRGVFHCFSGGPAEARAVTERGFHLGLGGMITYAPERWEPVVRALPAERILFETDCPYLRPAPDRRGRNEPAFLYRTAELVARLRGVDPTEMERTADANARALFGLPEA
jgi:TatD DNase family protein